MSVPVQTPSKEYIANGTTTAFPLEFNCDKAEYLIVTLNGEEAPVGSWTLANDTVTFNVAPLNGVVVNLERNTPFQRTTNYQLYDNSFRPSAVNKDFDLIWWKLQELGYRDQVIWLALVKEISDRIAGDDNLQNQINTINEWLDNLQQNVNENTSDIAQLVTDLSKEIADRIKGDQILKDMFLSMIDEAINEGTINALAVTHVDSLGALDAIANVWDGRTVYVKDLGHYEYDSDTTTWVKVYQDANNVKDGLETQEQINDKSVRVFETIADLLAYAPRIDKQTVDVLSYNTPNYALANPFSGGDLFTYVASKSTINNGVTIFNGWVRHLNDKILTTEDAGLTGVIATDGDSTTKLNVISAAAKDGFHVKFIGEFLTSTHVLFENIKNLKIEHIQRLSTDEIKADRNNFTFNGTFNYRGIIQLNSCPYVHLKSINIKGANVIKYNGVTESSEDGDCGICALNCDYGLVEDCNLHYFMTWAIFFIDSNYVTAQRNKIWRCTRQSGINISCAGYGYKNINIGSRYLHNIISDCGLAGIELEGQTPIQDCLVSGNKVVDCRVGANLTPHGAFSEESSVIIENNYFEKTQYGTLFDSASMPSNYIIRFNDYKNARINFGIASCSTYKIIGNTSDSKGVDGNSLFKVSAHDNILEMIDSRSFYVNKHQSSLNGVGAGTILYFGNNNQYGYTVSSVKIVATTKWTPRTEVYKVTLIEDVDSGIVFAGERFNYIKYSTSYITYISTDTTGRFNGLIKGNSFANFTHGIRGAETTFIDKSHEITDNVFKNIGYYIYNEYPQSTAWFVHNNIVHGTANQSKCFGTDAMLLNGSLVPNGVRTLRLNGQGAFSYISFAQNVQTVKVRARIFGGNMNGVASTIMGLHIDGVGVGNKTITNFNEPAIHEWIVSESYSGLSDFGQTSVRILFSDSAVTFTYAELEIFYI